MASREIEQFRRHGLGSPICIKPGLRSYLFLLFAGPLLIGGSVLALAKGGPLTFLAGLIGLPLSAFACLLYLVILLRSRRRGPTSEKCQFLTFCPFRNHGPFG
jgi:hypothetical protein